MPVPTTGPEDRKPSDVPPAASYVPGQRVWVFQDRWWPGAVEAASAAAVRVRYQVGHNATGVNDFRPDCVAPRAEPTAIDRHLRPCALERPWPAGRGATFTAFRQEVRRAAAV
ncbi:hypothetical protein J2S41_004481 [Catenuloplanes atrovinosus]|uniref:Uncharacterized protein n=1 Tax=Catenuloplanes atrovinosus TaxID=137266 RepID=A0AAE3YPM6_9ACTN|nr:hypothetical protein [Catenuloplanes atrovinosus]